MVAKVIRKLLSYSFLDFFRLSIFLSFFYYLKEMWFEIGGGGVVFILVYAPGSSYIISFLNTFFFRITVQIHWSEKKQFFAELFSSWKESMYSKL